MKSSLVSVVQDRGWKAPWSLQIRFQGWKAPWLPFFMIKVEKRLSRCSSGAYLSLRSRLKSPLVTTVQDRGWKAPWSQQLWFQCWKAHWLPFFKIDVEKPLGHHNSSSKVEKPLGCLFFKIGVEKPLGCLFFKIEVKKPLGCHSSDRDWKAPWLSQLQFQGWKAHWIPSTFKIEIEKPLGHLNYQELIQRSSTIK